jgi:hypothetical protein
MQKRLVDAAIVTRAIRPMEQPIVQPNTQTRKPGSGKRRFEEYAPDFEGYRFTGL